MGMPDAAPVQMTSTTGLRVMIVARPLSHVKLVAALERLVAPQAPTTWTLGLKGDAMVNQGKAPDLIAEWVGRAEIVPMTFREEVFPG